MKNIRPHLSEDEDTLSEEIHDIVGSIPHWIISFGISLFFVVILVLLFLSWLIRYPDIITSRVTITTENPPATLIARATGRINEIFIKDKQKVAEGSLLVSIENPANYSDVVQIKKQLESLMPSISIGTLAGDPVNLFQKKYSLGEIQTGFEIFLNAYSAYDIFLKTRYYPNKIESLKSQLNRQLLYKESLLRQRKIQEDDFFLIEKRLTRGEALYKSKMISEAEIDDTKSQYLKSKLALDQTASNILNAESQIAQTTDTIKEYELNFIQQKQKQFQELKAAYENILSDISKWEFNYLLISPINGNISLINYWSKNQYIKAGEQVAIVIPDEPSRIVGKVILPLPRSGKVNIGLNVNVKLLDFPSTEYGMIEGRIRSKSLVSSDNNYLLEIDFPSGLKTNYGKDIEFRHEMQGTCDIIAEDIRLFWRILNPIKEMIKFRIAK